MTRNRGNATTAMLCACLAMACAAAGDARAQTPAQPAPTKPAPIQPAPGAEREYRLDGGDCAGLPRLPIGTAAGLCAGKVIAPEPGQFRPRAIRMPRALLPLDDKGRDWLVTDLGDWRAGRGAVWRLRWTPGQPVRTQRLLSGLSMPHTVARGPDGRIYVGEMSRIIRFDPDAADPAASIVPVVDALPDNRLHDDRHPLSAFVFMPDGALVIDVGAASDACAEPDHRDAANRCTELSGPDPRAGLRRYAYLGAGKWDARFTVLASGLRNSVALVVTPTGALLQGENSTDFPDPLSPYDEVNLIKPGGFYGWPYCFDLDRTAPAFAAKPPMDCKGPAHVKPLLLLPPHTAPIGMAYYRGALFPQLNGKLLMTWRGYRSPGARVVAFDTDAAGLPTPKRGARYDVYKGTGVEKIAYGLSPAAEPLVLTPGWDKRPGLRPRGAPAGLAVSPDGSIWVCDDKNGLVLRLAPDGMAPNARVKAAAAQPYSTSRQ